MSCSVVYTYRNISVFPLSTELNLILESRYDKLMILKSLKNNDGIVVLQNQLNSVPISGYVCAYLASIFYLASRLPQLYKNVRVTAFSALLGRRNVIFLNH